MSFLLHLDFPTLSHPFQYAQALRKITERSELELLYDKFFINDILSLLSSLISRTLAVEEICSKHDMG
jgi:hypothetical protein